MVQTMAAVAAVSGCRPSLTGNYGHLVATNSNSVLDMDMLGYQFHVLYRGNVDQNKKKAKKKKTKRKNKAPVAKAVKDKQKLNVHFKDECNKEAGAFQSPFVEVCSIPSGFAVYAGVRQSVLEKQIREAASLFSAASSGKLSDDEDEEDEEEKLKVSSSRIPKIVGIGLCSVFELVSEIKFSHPVLCTRALEALLDILQGQQPEGLKAEPPELIDSLFNLLLELSNSQNVDSKDAQDVDTNSSLTSVACSCLLSLVVARGDTGKLLSATSSVLMSPRNLVTEDLKIPFVLTSLQRSVHAVLLGRTALPDWFSTGILRKGLIGSFALSLPEDGADHYSMTSDGKYLYIHSNNGNLYKVGTGYNGTVQGHIYGNVTGEFLGTKGWLGFAENHLFFKSIYESNVLTILDHEKLKEIKSIFLEGKDIGSGVTFSDGENICTISSTKDDSFVVRTFNSFASKAMCVNELPLKLARKCVDLFGWASFDEEMSIHTITPSFDDETCSISGGKDFALMRTASGRILFYGKAPSLGIKQAPPSSNRWIELPITKSPKIVQFSIGHEGLHALLVAEDGSVFFVGIARRGEDGDLNKGRRQPKPVKPKKMIKVESLNVTYSACNNGTSALITKDGELYMFGKDTNHCHSSTNLVTDLKDVSVSQVALGKAHVVALCAKGNVYTFGINNKGQCGREFATHVKDAVMTAVTTRTNEDDGEEDDVETEEPEVICSVGQHQWKQDECMVCTLCGECTGFGVSCISKGQPDRNPGAPCGCGWGESGCIECGCCKTCAGENKVESVLAAEFDLLLRRRPISREEENVHRKVDERRQRHKIGSKPLKVNVKNVKPHRIEPDVEKPSIPIIITDEVTSSDQEKENKMTSLPPARVLIPGNHTVTNVACGLHHTVLLLQNGEVMTFGSNQHGQLGLYDLTPRGLPVAVYLPSSAIQIAAGSNHTVILSSNASVYTFGSYQKGQLGRTSQHDNGKRDRLLPREAPWFSFPGAVPNIGPKFGRRPTWVGAAGDQTFLKIDESLINAHNLANSTVVANNNSICLIPSVNSSFKCLLINKIDGNCRSFNDSDQEDLNSPCVCLDQAYNVLWSFDNSKNRVNCYNVLAGEINSSNNISSPFHTFNSFDATNGLKAFDLVPQILTPKLALPMQPRFTVSRVQASLHLLACLDTLVLAQELNWKVQHEETSHQSVCKIYSKEDFNVVNRFESHGGGWGYSGHSIEAIRFMVDSDVLLGGFGLFGGRGEYTGKIKLFDIGMDGGDQELDGEVIAETEEIPYECGARQKFSILFDEPVALQANRWYVAWARVSGPSSDCGSSGQCTVSTEGQVSFHFKSSKKSNNGTDVNAGQIPQLLYKIITQENPVPSYKVEASEPVYVLTKDFSRSVTPDCLQSLLLLLEWSWSTFKSNISKFCNFPETSASARSVSLLDLDRLVYISCACLRLLRTYVNEVYPNSAQRNSSSEVLRIVECVAEMRTLLRHILSDPIPDIVQTAKLNNHLHKNSKIYRVQEINKLALMGVTILEECHITFVTCFHAFYPTSQLKWACLCDLLSSMEIDSSLADGCDQLLAAILASLCSPAVRLTSVLPIIMNSDEGSTLKKYYMSGNGSAGLNPNLSAESPYPLLLDYMTKTMQRDNKYHVHYTFTEVLERVLTIVVRPLEVALGDAHNSPSSILISNTCSLLAAIVAELAAQSIGVDADVPSGGGRVLNTTPTRFTRTSQSRTWNTGNGSPDAICFSVDRSGIVIVGVTLYGGVGTYEYELELLDDQSDSTGDSTHIHRWNSLEIVKGTFGSDDCVGEITEVKFEHPIPIKEHTKYAIRLRNHGGRTTNGDGGINSVRGPDGTVFTFGACSLSFNGTNHNRGQIPQILYYSTPQDSDSQQNNCAIAELQARKSALFLASSIIKAASFLLKKAREETDDRVVKTIATSHLTSELLPLVLAHISPLATSDPRSAVQVLNMIQEILPSVAHLNNCHNCHSESKLPSFTMSDINVNHDVTLCTTSNHYAIVESEHPYKPASVATYKVAFSDTVKWMLLEFDSQCGTAQNEDVLQLYVPSVKEKNLGMATVHDDEQETFAPYWPVLHRFCGGSNWPRSGIILPGNEVVFSLETASDYIKDDKACFYGFKCLVIGYDFARPSVKGLRHLEVELAYLGGMCVSSLMRKDLLLPPISVEEMEDDLEVVDEIANQIYKAHSALFNKGFAIGNPPTVQQALEGVLPYNYLSNERSFLKDFVLAAPGTSGGRLARWLQPDSYVDPKHCEIYCNKDELKCGWSTIVTVSTKDQYKDVVLVPNLKVEVKAVPIDKRDNGVKDSNRKMARISKPDALTLGGYPLPNISLPYEVTVKDKMCYFAISMMKAYENYSFEELRYTTPALKRPSENMMVRANNDGNYSCSWTPSSVGWYLIRVSIDGFEIENSQKVEVKEPPQGVIPPSQDLSKKVGPLPHRVKKYVAKYSAGLRIRAHPSLQSEQIGIIPVDGVVTYVDEAHHDDGIWVRLTQDSIKNYCQNVHLEAWCLQYHKHLGSTLLVPIEESKSLSSDKIEALSRRSSEDIGRENRKRRPVGGPGWYTVIKCGASGHNIRSSPNLKAPPVGMLVLGNKLNTVEELRNSEGVWAKLDAISMRRYCFNTDGEAWSLAQNRNSVKYLQHENDFLSKNDLADENSLNCDDDDCENFNGVSLNWPNTTSSPTPTSKPFDFSSATFNPQSSFGSSFGQQRGVFMFGSSVLDDTLMSKVCAVSPVTIEAASARGSSYGSPPVPPKPKVASLLKSSSPVMHKWTRPEEGHQYHSSLSNVPPELIGVSVKELVKVLGESRVNGNESTPPHTPPGTPPRRSRSSSPKHVIPLGGLGESSPIAIPETVGSLKSESFGCDSPGSSPSSIKSLPASPMLGSGSRRGSYQRLLIKMDSPLSSHHIQGQRNGTTMRRATTLDIGEHSSKCFVQTGTQTSPDGSGHFSIGTGSPRSQEPGIRVSPKLARKDYRVARQFRTKRERAQSPAPAGSSSNEVPHIRKLDSPKEIVKNAMSPLVAECLRTVFAAFLWHEGIVHDAMACASFLKFHPDLPKHLSKFSNTDNLVSTPTKSEVPLSKEQKARLRHSVEVSASNFLNIQMNSAEVFAKSLANANVNKNKLPKPATDTIREETGLSGISHFGEASGIASAVNSGSTTTVTSPVYSFGIDDKLDSDLPPSLRQLLILWERLTFELLKIMSQQLVKLSASSLLVRGNNKGDRDRASLINGITDRKGRKKKEWLQLQVSGSRGNLFGEASGSPFGVGAERETTCELCGNLFPHPVTYHMKQAHPGCGGHAGGKGYNSGGNFCGGWAGNCGDGGVGGSSWYLICDKCREKYLRQKRQSILKEKSKKSRKKTVPNSASSSTVVQGNPKLLLTSPLPPMETHLVMKQNAAFLLDLASANGTASCANRRSPHNSVGMPSVDEHSVPNSLRGENTNGGSFPTTSFQCLKMLGVPTADSSLINEHFLLEENSLKKRQVKNREDFNGSIGLVGTATLHSLAEISGSDDSPGSSDGTTPDLPKGGRTFHRSISVGTTTREWNPKESGDGRVIMTRKRNKSSGESIDGSSLLCHPSATLNKLVMLATDKQNPAEILNRPIISFVLQRHDLQSLRLAMKQAVRKAACRAYGMQGLNWLIRSVTQPTALHDLLWFFVASLSPSSEVNEEPNEEDNSEVNNRRTDGDHLEREVAVYDHPLSDIILAGEAVRPLVSAFHSLLQSISDLMMLLPMSSSLQQMAMRCWCLKFQQSDHVFLHRCHVFSNISKILSRSEEELCCDADSVSSDEESAVDVECLKDLTSGLDLKASSRPGMLGSLTDNSTETFWESGDEDRNKTKILTITCSSNYHLKIIYVHIDNCRDLGNKVSSVAFKSSLQTDEFVKLRNIEIESRFTGWVSCHISEGRPNVLKLELKGPDNTLRVRQVKVLGFTDGQNLKVLNQPNAIVIQQRNCEAETLKVFRLLTSQVFGKLISSNDGSDADMKSSENASLSLNNTGDQKAERNNDLKEHMVGILFSRSKLTHLQKQVCTHIVQALRAEASRVREEWEALLCSKSLSMEELPKSSDAYCFEMLSMVLALSGSSVGRAYLAQQYSLLRDLLSLLHTGSARVQRQITSLLRRVLPEVSPQTFAQILSVRSLPPTNYSIVTETNKEAVVNTPDSSFDIHKMGILDVFFSCIAKALTVQVKVKGKETNKGMTTVTLATSIHPRDNLGARWCLRGCISRKLAEVIIQLLHDMATGKLSDAWASITKGAVAENILNLTKLDERCRNPSDCLKTPTIWLALASLCVLNQDHVERLSSGQWIGSGDGQQAVSRPMCINHDDGETLAIILCNICGNLCADCDRFLHLHRRTHSHQRQVFKEEEEAIKVDLHEGCGRTKLFWILALADSRTLKAMVEFREGARGKSASSASGACRFCGAMGETSLLAIGNVCGDAECQEHARSACSKILLCGHACGGIKNESICLPCLHGCSGDHTLKQDADDMCMICFTEALSCAPATQLRCGHVFHLHCCRKVLLRKWTGPRITFGFSHCPICKNPIDQPVLKDLLEPLHVLYEDVRRKALMRLEYEDLHKAEAITTPGARFFEDPVGYAMERYAYYVCYSCQKAYYGGEARCDIEAGGGDDYDPRELVCGGCSDVSRAQMCPKHGTDFLEYKCRYCCSVAVFFCFGTTHFCNACHDDFQHVTNIPKLELPRCPAGPKGKQLEGDECPLHIQHPATGEEFALGCGVCRNAHTF